MTSFWSLYIILLVVVNIVGCAWMLHSMRKHPKSEGKTTGHSYDGIEELNTPLPRWWLWLFWITLIFSVVYLLLFPGLGSYKGLLGWTSEKQWQQEQTQAEKLYGPVFQQYYATSIPELARNQQAMTVAQRLFSDNCAACHGVDATGNKGFPNLTDSNWYYGNEPETLVTTITNGRHGMMPALAGAIGGEDGVEAVTAYVRQLNGYPVDKELAKVGGEKFKTICVACHGADAKGNKMLGAPDLTNNMWVYGGDEETIKETIRLGRSGVMPAQVGHLSKEKIHMLAAYIYGLSHESKDNTNSERK